LDDIIVYGRTVQEHNDRLVEVFDRLREHNLKLQVDKCEFLRDRVNYLGYVISKEGLLPGETKVPAVPKFPHPTNTETGEGFSWTHGILSKIYCKLQPHSKTVVLFD
jgi:hypothetical protein